MCGQLSPLTRDFHRLLKNVKKLTNNQVKVLDYDDDICEFILEIKPSDGFYRKGKFEFKVEPKEYPQNAPRVQCLTDIYHPNINSECERDVCLSLFDEWTAQNDFEDCVQGLLFLLYNPNLEDPLNPYFDPSSEEQIENFANDVEASLEGGIVEDFYYERNIVEEVNFNENLKENATEEVELGSNLGATEAKCQAASSSTTTATPLQITAMQTAVAITAEASMQTATTETTRKPVQIAQAQTAAPLTTSTPPTTAASTQTPPTSGTTVNETQTETLTPSTIVTTTASKPTTEMTAQVMSYTLKNVNNNTENQKHSEYNDEVNNVNICS